MGPSGGMAVLPCRRAKGAPLIDKTSAEISEDSLSAVLDDADFQAIHSRMSRFNLFEAVGAVRGELRHSISSLICCRRAVATDLGRAHSSACFDRYWRVCQLNRAQSWHSNSWLQSRGTR